MAAMRFFALSISLSSLERTVISWSSCDFSSGSRTQADISGYWPVCASRKCSLLARLPRKAVRNESPFFSNFSATFKVAELLLETTATV